MNKKEQILSLLKIVSNMLSELEREQSNSEVGDKLNTLLEEVSELYNVIHHLKSMREVE